MYHFSTQFDSRYVINGVALYRSIDRHCESFRLHVMALDDDAYEIMDSLDLPNVSLTRVETLEEFDSELLSIKDTRPLVQYYFTCVPAFNWYLLQERGMDRITYTGADLYFYSPLAALMEMMDDASIVIHTHRRPPGADDSSGKFNAEFESFKNDATGRTCLENWRENCIKWCYGRQEGEKWANQGYLNSWPDRYEDVKILDDPGVGLARWNRETHSLSERDEKVYVDGEPLMFYHFSNLERITSQIWDPPITNLNHIEESLIYEPYLCELMDVERMIRTETGMDPDYGSLFFPKLREIPKASWKAIGRNVLHKIDIGMKFLKGDLIRVSDE